MSHLGLQHSETPTKCLIASDIHTKPLLLCCHPVCLMPQVCCQQPHPTMTLRGLPAVIMTSMMTTMGAR
jgi:hypothetical protein